MGESATRFPTRVANQTNKRRDELRGWEGKTRKLSLSIEWKGLLESDESWCEAVCTEYRERWVGVKRGESEALSQKTRVNLNEGVAERGMRDSVTPCSHKDLILIYAYSSLGLEY